MAQQMTNSTSTGVDESGDLAEDIDDVELATFNMAYNN
jgi:hypothetical protein